MKKVLFRESSRGHKNHGWLDTKHTFSFANYFNPERINFGAIRVLNDDIVMGGEGFSTHPHDNMEIISIPLYGALEHKDNMGNGSVIRPGEVQVMSAGTGITHSEYNANQGEDVNFFQLWIFPNKENVTPRYGQMKFDFPGRKNKLIQIVSPDPRDEGLWIYQDAWLHMGLFDQGRAFEYKLRKPENGLFVMVVEGKFEVANETLNRRDAIGISETDAVDIVAKSADAQILLIEVPMYKVTMD